MIYISFKSLKYSLQTIMVVHGYIIQQKKLCSYKFAHNSGSSSCLPHEASLAKLTRCRREVDYTSTYVNISGVIRWPDKFVKGECVQQIFVSNSHSYNFVSHSTEATKTGWELYNIHLAKEPSIASDHELRLYLFIYIGSNGGGSNGSAIAGGIIGAIIAVVLIVIILIVWLWRFVAQATVAI